MEDLKIDTETAKLIVQAYQKINTLKSLLNKEPYAQIKDFFDSGTALSEMMNSAIEETTKKGLESKLISLSTHLKSLSVIHKTLIDAQQKQEINTLFIQLKTDIISLQSKINEKK